jgi:hypothetical protein
MAQKVQTLLIDDPDGGEAEATVRFGLDGTEYEIDLSAKHPRRCGRHWSRTLAPHAGHLDLSLGVQAAADVAQLPPPGLTLPRSGSGPRLRASRSKTAAGYRPNWSSSSRRLRRNSRAVARLDDIASPASSARSALPGLGTRIQLHLLMFEE